MELKRQNEILEIVSENASVYFDIEKKEVFIEKLSINFPGEYEKGGIIVEVKEYENHLFYSFGIEGKNLLIVTTDTFEQKEEILSFFGDVDVLVILGTKKAAKLFENIESRLVVPYGEEVSQFFMTLGQNDVEEKKNYKVGKELPSDNSEFVYLV